MAPALAADVGNRRNGTISAWTSQLRRQFVSRFGACVVDADLKHREAALQLESAAHRAFAGAEFGLEKPVYLNGETAFSMAKPLCGSWIDRPGIGHPLL